MTTLITGASSGIGEALAKEIARREGAAATLFICGRNKERLDAVAAACRAFGAKCEASLVDVTDADAVRSWVDAADAVSPIERVFANAGVSTGAETEANVRATFATNVGGCVNTVLPALAIFQRRKSGHRQIVITSSIAGYGPLSSCPSYSATKSCVKTWGLSLRGMLAAEGIQVSVVCPGFVRSRITDRNTCPMPFFMEAEKAARIILDRAGRNAPLIAFPWPMRFASWAFSCLPARLVVLLSRLLPAKVESKITNGFARA